MSTKDTVFWRCLCFSVFLLHIESFIAAYWVFFNEPVSILVLDVLTWLIFKVRCFFICGKNEPQCKHHFQITFLNLNTDLCDKQHWWSSWNSDEHHWKNVLLSYISPHFCQNERGINIWEGYLIIHLKRWWAILSWELPHVKQAFHTRPTVVLFWTTALKSDHFW